MALVHVDQVHETRVPVRADRRGEFRNLVLAAGRKLKLADVEKKARSLTLPDPVLTAVPHAGDHDRVLVDAVPQHVRASAGGREQLAPIFVFYDTAELRAFAKGCRSLQDPFGGSSSGRRVLGAQEVPESGEISNCVRSPPERLHRVRTLRMRAGGCCSPAVPHVLSHSCTSSSAMYSPVAS